MELKRELTERQRALLWLSAAEVTADRVRQLTEEFGSPEEIYQAFGQENGPQFQAKARERLKTLRNTRIGCAPLTIFLSCCTMLEGFPA